MRSKHIAAFTVLTLLSAFSFIANASQKPLTWIPTWYASPEPGWSAPASLTNQTIREIIRNTVGGKYVRLRLSNQIGAEPLHLDAVDIAKRDSGGDITPGSSMPVLFQGHADVTIAPGAYVVSDPIAFDTAPQTDLAVSIYSTNPISESTLHGVQRSAVYVGDGNQTDAAHFVGTASTKAPWQAWVWLDEVEVADSAAKGTVVAFGDSITDGVGPAQDSHQTWPDVFAARLQSAKIPLSVINAGISGNRVLHNGGPFGVAALARFDSDVLAQPNVKDVIVLLGINDIGQVDAASPDAVSANEIEDGLAQLAVRAHEHNIKIYVATLTPFKITTIKNYYSDDKETKRQAVNSWIRSNTVFDGVVDFEKAVEDPANPAHMLPLYDCGDHLHPSGAGDVAMANSIPLGWFK